VVDAEAVVESGVGEKAVPARADGGCAWEGGGQRGKAQEDLSEQVVVFQRRRRRREGEAAADAGRRHITLALLLTAGARCKCAIALSQARRPMSP
jgi:hypothetical protein